MHDYRKLRVWADARTLAQQVYRLTTSFPRYELFGLTQQMRRAGVSVVSNLAEGAGRSGDRDFARFVGIAIGSACELEAQLDIALDLGYVNDSTYAAMSDRIVGVKLKLAGLEKRLRERFALRST
ncbi:MAG: four helix bundle protein [Acidimicrobiia bacterium]|nr:four helix bundle protein [Acidimicrobiia bacterium]